MISAASDRQIPVIRPAPLRAFGGIWRLTWRRFFTGGQFLLLLGLIALLGLLSLVRIRSGHQADFMPWIAEFYLGFIVPVIAFLAGAAAIRDEMKSSTADYVLTRPIRRVHLVVFKFLSHLLCLQAFYVVVLVVVLGLAPLVHVPGVASGAPRLFMTQLIALTCFSALGFLFGAVSARYLVLGLIYAVAVELAVGRIPTQLNNLSMTHQLDKLLQPLLTHGPGFASSPANAISIVLLLLGQAAVFLALSCLMFSRKELAGAGARAT